MKNTVRVAAAVMALAIGSAGYVASAEAAMMKMDHKMMMHKMKKHKMHHKMMMHHIMKK